MSRRDKKKVGNPNPPRTGNWLEKRATEKTVAVPLAKVEMTPGKHFTLYPVGRMRKVYRSR